MPLGMRHSSDNEDGYVSVSCLNFTDIFGYSTGKTLTVECVANDTLRPLLALTAADIGLREDSEANLRRWFTLASKWDAILLIDEADLFLERRISGDVDRNSLVTGRFGFQF
jgi:AAA+ superfamily predicted ATPase